jgi:predicted nucleic acid-binding protein
MPGYLLDTNVVSDAFRPQPNPQIAKWMNDRADQDFFISAIVLGEIWQGVALSGEGRRKRALLDWFDGPTGPEALFAGRILAFGREAALQWGDLIAEGFRVGRPRSQIDMQIAATAIVHQCEVVTVNVSDFAPVRDKLAIVDPTLG